MVGVMFLTAEQVAAFVDATPWPYNALVHVAAWWDCALRSWPDCRCATWNCRNP